MFSQPDRAGFLPLDQLPALVGRLMQLGYRCLGPAVENGAIVMRELDARDALPRGLQAEQAPGRYDWSEVDRIVDPYRESSFVVILCLYGSNPAIDPSGAAPTVGSAPLLKAWLEFARAAQVSVQQPEIVEIVRSWAQSAASVQLITR